MKISELQISKCDVTTLKNHCPNYFLIVISSWKHYVLTYLLRFFYLQVKDNQVQLSFKMHFKLIFFWKLFIFYNGNGLFQKDKFLLILKSVYMKLRIAWQETMSHLIIGKNVGISKVFSKKFRKEPFRSKVYKSHHFDKNGAVIEER